MSLSKEAWSPRSDLEKVAANDPSLTAVYWRRKGIGDEEVIKLAEALRDNSHVTTLWLRGNKITDVGAKALAEVLRVNSTITHLGLSDNEITDASAKALAEMLRVNATVAFVDLGINKITDAGAKALAEVLRTNATITQLDLSYNNISDAGAKALAEMLRVNGTVTILSLERNNVNADLKQKVDRLWKINKEASTPEDARRRKEAEFGPPPATAASEVTASSSSKEAKSEVAEATTVAKPPAPSQDVVATSSGRKSSGGRGRRANNRFEQERRNRELAERLQREEEERASPTRHTAAAKQGVAAAAGTAAIPAAAAADGAARAAPPHTPRMHAHGQSLTREEQAAVAHLTKNIADIDRTLESVRGLPESLAGAAPEVQRYFLTFAAAFERAYVAAQALASGAVKVQLSSMKDQVLEGVLKAVGNVAGASNVPAVGLVSIVASIIVHQRETRQVNLLTVFQDFFRGDSRDQYLITYRRLAEQICRRSDFSSYASDVEAQKQDKRHVMKLVQKVRKRLESAHFLSLDNVERVVIRATADLVQVTEIVLSLHQDAPTQFESLKSGPDEEKVQFLLKQLKLENRVTQHYGGALAHQAFQRPRQRATPHAQMEERSGPAKDTAWFDEMEREIFRLGQENKQLRQESKERKAVQTRLRRLEEKVGSERDIATSGGGNQVQAQLQRSRNARSGHRGAAQASTELDSFQREMYRELQDIRETVAAQSDQVAANSENSFIANRVLTRSEAFQLIKIVMNLAGVDVSASGAFTFEGKGYKIGLYSSRLLSARKNLWKDRAQLKIDQVYNGSKPVSHWFERNELLFVYESNIKRAVRQLFADEFDVISASTSRVSEDSTHEMEQDRRRLFGND